MLKKAQSMEYQWVEENGQRISKKQRVKGPLQEVERNGTEIPGLPSVQAGNPAQHVKPQHGKKKHKRTASLTELRPEDKKKVANLIQELAHLGNEKERIEQLLNKERTNFQAAIKELVSDQKKLITERQTVQVELMTCQKMLNQLQEVVLNRPTSIEGETPTVGSNSSRSHRKISEFDRISALDEYIMKQNSMQESMEVASDIDSQVSDIHRHPRFVSHVTLSIVSSNY